jgi:hypothetical protein
MLSIDRWISAYGRAWEDGDDPAVAELFTQDAIYRSHPFREPMREAVRSAPIGARRPLIGRASASSLVPRTRAAPALRWSGGQSCAAIRAR